MVKGRGPRKKGAESPLEWEPSVRDLEIYALLAEGKTTRVIAAKYKVSHTAIVKVGAKIDRWLVPQWMDKIRDIKAFHTEALMHIFREAMTAWELSKADYLTVTEKDGEKPETVTQRKHNKLGAATYLGEARAALAEIRKIWGADAPPKSSNEDNLPRAAGMPPDMAREVYVKHKMDELQKMLEPSAN